MNWNVLLVIVFYFMLKEMTVANGLYKTNEPVLITTHRHEVCALTHTHVDMTYSTTRQKMTA